MRSSRLVAESLTVMPPPVAHPLPSARWLAAPAMQVAWEAAWRPAHCPQPPPHWLRSGQAYSWQRTVAAIEVWRGAILAEPVGSGKSWIALAVAQRFAHQPVVIGPAALAAQWDHTAIRAGMSIHWHSHERLSRGATPEDRGDFVIVDEAHRFRHLHTQRALTLAPWLVGRRTLLLTATPIINRRADLIALLQLIVPDDALALDGIASLRALEEAHRPPKALTRIVIRTMSAQAGVPTRDSILRAGAAEQARCGAAARAIASLALSADHGVRRLLTTVLLDAVASSDAAWRAALRRYQALLLQSRDAGGLSRGALRHFAGPALDQLVLWPLLAATESVDPPPLADLDKVVTLLATGSPPEGWMERVEAVLTDGRPTICFTRHRATARALVRHLGDHTAWVTGDASGIGPHRVEREHVLSAFGPQREEWRIMVRRPTCLVCTEVLAEGLDLQGASRVIHLDLPWHPARLAQRNGRVRRMGQLAPHVEVVTRRPSPAIERLLGVRRTIRRKARLSERWLGTLTTPCHTGESVAPGVWCTVGRSVTQTEAVATVTLRAGTREGTIALQLREGLWHPAHDLELPAFEPCTLLQHSRLDRSCCTRFARRAVWRALELARSPGVSRTRLVSRLLVMAHDARCRRDRGTLERLDQLLSLAGRHAPLGLEQRLAALTEASDRELLSAAIPPASDPPRALPISVLLVLFRSEESRLR